MTTFDKREEAFEKKFVIEQEQRFRLEAHCDRLLGQWAAQRLGKTGEEAAAYANDVVATDIEQGGRAGLIRKIVADLKTQGITEYHVQRKLHELMAAARIEMNQ